MKQCTLYIQYRNNFCQYMFLCLFLQSGKFKFLELTYNYKFPNIHHLKKRESIGFYTSGHKKSNLGETVHKIMNCYCLNLPILNLWKPTASFVLYILTHLKQLWKTPFIQISLTSAPSRDRMHHTKSLTVHKVG